MPKKKRDNKSLRKQKQQKQNPQAPSIRDVINDADMLSSLSNIQPDEFSIQHIAFSSPPDPTDSLRSSTSAFLEKISDSIIEQMN